MEARDVAFGVRLDIDDKGASWINGHIDPEALLNAIDRISAKPQVEQVRLYASRIAHAKLYVGQNEALCGSANLTMRGFGGGPEIVCMLTSVSAARQCAKDYLKRLDLVDLSDLRRYVAQYSAAAASARKERRRRGMYDEDRLPASNGLAEYPLFIEWLDEKPWKWAKTIAARERGKSNLQGHVRSSFRGLRQFFSAYPDLVSALAAKDLDKYRLERGSPLEGLLASFVERNATDEKGFTVAGWRHYLPVECGGVQPKRGGSIGTLQKMLPLMARYYAQLRP